MTVQVGHCMGVGGVCVSVFVFGMGLQFLLHAKSNSVLSFDLYGVLRVVSAPRRLNYS